VTRRTLSILLVFGLLAGSSAPAASAAQKLNVYQKMVIDLIQDQRLDACKYTTEELKKAKAYVPVDAQQYNAALIAAFDDALAARAQGACNKKNQATAPPPAAQAQPPAQGTPQQPGPPPAQSGVTTVPATQPPAVAAQPQQAQPPPTPRSEPTAAPAIAAGDEIALASQTTEIVPDAPFPMLALAILLAVLALCTLTFGVWRWLAWEPRWAVRLRHAAGEAGWRASSTWADFTDYVRLGR